MRDTRLLASSTESALAMGGGRNWPASESHPQAGKETPGSLVALPGLSYHHVPMADKLKMSAEP